jgi:hypothetical protein
MNHDVQPAGLTRHCQDTQLDPLPMLRADKPRDGSVARAIRGVTGEQGLPRASQHQPVTRAGSGVAGGIHVVRRVGRGLAGEPRREGSGVEAPVAEKPRQHVGEAVGHEHPLGP